MLLVVLDTTDSARTKPSKEGVNSHGLKVGVNSFSILGLQLLLYEALSY